MTDKEKLDQIEMIIDQFDNEVIDNEEMTLDSIRKSLKGERVSFEPTCEPSCTASEEEQEESGVECEFEQKGDSWWCTTHNCWA
jgi:hypothetical protein